MLSPVKKGNINTKLMKIIIISAALHVVGGLILGGITIVKYIIPNDTQFEEPPNVNEEKPPAEVKVEIKPTPPRIKQSLRNLKIKQVGNIAVNDVSVNLPNMDQSFTVTAGLGNFSAGRLIGSKSGSLNMGISNVNVFGLKAKAERILFIIDANRGMLTDKKGGLNSYTIIKDEITDMVGNLSAGTLFNVVMRDGRRIMQFKPQFVSAGAEVHQQLVKWIAPINTNADNPGLYVPGIKNVIDPSLDAMPEHEMQTHILSSNANGNMNAFITQFALEERADAIFFISGYHHGFEELRTLPSKKQINEFEKLKASKAYQDQLAQHRIDAEKMWAKVRQELARTNAQRSKNGQPPRVLAQPQNLHLCVHELGLKWEGARHPGHGAGFQVIESRKVVQYFR